MSTAVSSHGTWIAEVIVVPKPGVNDPQGEAIRGGLGSLGYTGVERVRSGRFFRVELTAVDEAAARSDATAMCERLLSNPVIESYSLSLRQLGRRTPDLGDDR